MNLLHQVDEIIGDRYQIQAILGRGGMGTTYEALDLSNSQQVVLKVISLREAENWKVLELFEREGKVLASLNHPFIPKYLNRFQLDTADDRRFYLIRQLIPGDCLATLIAGGWRVNEEEAKQIASQELNI